MHARISLLARCATELTSVCPTRTRVRTDEEARPCVDRRRFQAGVGPTKRPGRVWTMMRPDSVWTEDEAGPGVDTTMRPSRTQVYARPGRVDRRCGRAGCEVSTQPGRWWTDDVSGSVWTDNEARPSAGLQRCRAVCGLTMRLGPESRVAASGATRHSRLVQLECGRGEGSALLECHTCFPFQFIDPQQLGAPQ